MTITISRTELARNTRKIIDDARRAGPVVVESYGQQQAAVLDIVDYRLLKAVAAWQPDPTAPNSDPNAMPAGLALEDNRPNETDSDLQATWNRVLSAYLDVNISLGRAAKLLNLSRFELQDRLNRLDLPLRLGPQSIEDAVREIDAARDL